MSDIRFMVTIDSATAQASIKQIEGDIKGLAGTTSGARKESDAFERAAQNLWRQFVTGQIIVDGLRAGFHFMKNTIREMIEAASEAEKIDRGLDAALEITGRKVPGLADHFRDYAKSLMQVTVYDDEAIKKGQTLLLTLANLDRNGVDRATRGALGFASALGVDVDTAFMRVSNAMAGSTTALSRYGIRIQEGLSLEEKRAELLRQLEKMFGRATDEVNTHAGQVAQLKNRWKEAEEALGTWVVKNKGYLEVLNSISQALLDFLTKEEMVEKAEAALNETQDRQLDLLGRAAVQAGWAYGQMARLIEVYKGNTAALGMAIMSEKYGIEIKNAWIAVHQKATEKLKEQAEEQKKLEKGTNTLIEKTDKEREALQKIIDQADPLKTELRGLVNDMATVDKAFKSGQIPLTAYLKTMAWLQEEIRGVGKDTVSLAMTDPPKLNKAFQIVSANWEKHWKSLRPPWEHKWTEDFQAFGEKASAVMSKVQEVATVVFSSLDAIAAQSQKNKEITLDNEYKKRLEVIKATITNEDEQRAAIEALDAEYDIKRRSLQHAAAKQQKAAALAQAIINTAEGVTKALAQGGIFGPILAAAIAALGLIQIKLIAAQPIPFKEGTVFTKPTTLYSPSGQAISLGEGGEPEILAPESKLRRIVQEELRAAGRGDAGGAGVALGGEFNVSLTINTHGLADADLERATDKIFSVWEQGARKRGWKTNGRH